MSQDQHPPTTSTTAAPPAMPTPAGTPEAAIQFRLDRIFREMVEINQRIASSEIAILLHGAGPDRQISEQLRGIERMIAIADRRLDLIDAEIGRIANATAGGA